MYTKLNTRSDGPCAFADGAQVTAWETTARYLDLMQDNEDNHGFAMTDWSSVYDVIDTYEEGEPGPRGREILQAALDGGDWEASLNAWCDQIEEGPTS